MYGSKGSYQTFTCSTLPKRYFFEIHLLTTTGSSLRTKKGIIKSGEDFLAMVGYGIRGGRSRFFTYVLKEDKMFFCETGQEFFRFI